MNQHCGKHDKIFDENKPCPGCENEKAGIPVSSAAAMTDGLFNEKPAEEEGVLEIEDTGGEQGEENGGKKKSKRK